MKTLDTAIIKEKVKEALSRINFELKEEYLNLLKKARDEELFQLGRRVLEDLILNAQIAQEQRIPICQDTGMVNFYIEIGNEVLLTGKPLKEALNEAVREAYLENYLRPSVVRDPIHRENTKDNTPAIFHFDLVEGDKIKIYVMPKGAGSEQMCKLRMLAPHEGLEGIKKFVIDTVKEAGPNPCPPVTIGVGIGGSFDMVAFLAKKALLRPFGLRNQDPFYAELEEELLREINLLGLGPGGLGGKNYAMDVRVEVYPTHIAQLPVAVAFNCSANRWEVIEF